MAESYLSSETSQLYPMVNPKNNSDTCSKENKTLAVSDDLLGRKWFMNDEYEYKSCSRSMLVLLHLEKNSHILDFYLFLK